jgi:hypothetical protein
MINESSLLLNIASEIVQELNDATLWMLSDYAFNIFLLISELRQLLDFGLVSL